tara:strand:+ start:576 stop:851 length:276 start_codon:yes stop_codon:yes gene_type:complete
MKKVRVSHRSVYHKTVEVEVFIPNTIDEFDIQQYLNDNEHLWVDKVDQKLSEAKYEYGFGMDDGFNYYWTDKDQPCEWRYDCETSKTGGHL